jgi:TPR repeat protein
MVETDDTTQMSDLAKRFATGASVEKRRESGPVWTRAAEKGGFVCATERAAAPRRAQRWPSIVGFARPRSVAAMSKLGKCFFEGIALEKNAEKAVGWWTRATDKGDVDAMRSLAWCCSRGHGVEKNAAEKAVE